MSESETGSDVDATAPSDAFGRLGNEVRMAILRALVDDESASDVSKRSRSFSELFEASPADTTAGFAYHLRQLTDQYVEQRDEEYRLTYAGLRIARAIVAGTYTDSVDFGPVAVEDRCPFCDRRSLEAHGEDNYVTVACTDCERGILTLPFPPGGHRARSPADLLDAFDRHHRHRLSVMSDGICPECAATMGASVDRPPERVAERLPADDRAQLRLDCHQCGCTIHCPVTLAVLEHPAVISFYYDHGEDVRERPIWNVGGEWRETVLSEEPWCVRVSARLDEEVLSLYVDEDLSVVEVQRD